jgi:hypothetical protein
VEMLVLMVMEAVMAGGVLPTLNLVEQIIQTELL